MSGVVAVGIPPVFYGPQLRPHLSVFGALELELTVTADLDRFAEIVAYDHAHPVVGRDPLFHNHLLRRSCWPDADRSDALLLILHDGHEPAGCIGARLLIVGDLDDDIRTGRLHGIPADETQYRCERTSVGALVNDCVVVALTGLWKRAGVDPVVVRALGRAALAIALQDWMWDHVIGIQRRRILDHLSWETQGFTEASYRVWYGGERQFLVSMDRAQAALQARRTDGYVLESDVRGIA